MNEEHQEHVEKGGETSEPGRPQPEAAEVESARLMANQAKDPLTPEGFSEERIRKLADDYIARDMGEDLDDFLQWARAQGPEQ